jgi:hypothetical protein
MNYEIVKYNPIYTDQVCELEKEIWTPDQALNKSYLQWKYFDNPNAASPKIYLALREGKVVAVRCMNEMKWQLGNNGDGFTALCAGDAVIHPDHRNNAIYAELTKFLKNDLYKLGYRYLFSFSAGPATLLNSLAIGWKSIGRIRTMSKDSYRRSAVRTLMSGHRITRLMKNTAAASILRETVNKFGRRKALDFRKKLPAHIRVEESPIPDEMAVLAGKLVKDNKIVLTRDKKFYKWRYGNPFSKYIFLYWYDKELKGCLVAQTPVYNNDHMRRFNIIELEGVNTGIRMDLLKSAVSLLDSRSITIWTNMLDENCRKLLTLNGFIESKPTGSAAEYTPTVLVTVTKGPARQIEFRGTNLLDINNWDLKMMYSDAL